MGNIHSSAGVYTRETDLSQRIQGISTSVGAIVGRAIRGPVGQTTLVTSVREFIETFGKPNPQIGYLHYSAIAFLQEASRLYVTRVANNQLFGGCVVSSVVDNSVIQAQPWAGGEPNPQDYNFNSQDLFIVYGTNEGVWNNDLKIIVYPDTRIQNSNLFFLEVYELGNTKPTEKFNVSLQLKLDGYGRQLNLEQVINGQSNLIRVKQNNQFAPFIANENLQFCASLTFANLSGGSDGANPTIADYLQAWDLYDDPENIKFSLMINGGLTDVSIQAKMDEIATNRMDCCAILDVPSDKQKIQDAITWRRDSLNLDTSYSALYSPDLYISDEYNDGLLYVPPSGYIAAVCALTDRTRETWFAPAGMTRGHLNVRGLRHEYDLGQRDALQESQINPIRVVFGSGVKVWGQDTLQTLPSALQNLSVRRLMIFLENSISDSIIYSVFDPNDSFLRNSLKDRCQQFLEPVKRGRGVYGFDVVCDESNNFPETIANGDLMLDVYIDPVLPIKRIHLTAIINKTGVRTTLNN
jgi:Phage tail sheath protein subtilisin-like domain/Phage tail sheath C-terminal domain